MKQKNLKISSTTSTLKEYSVDGSKSKKYSKSLSSNENCLLSSSSKKDDCNTCVPPPLIPGCLPPLTTFKVEPPQTFVKVVNRQTKDIILHKASKVNFNCHIVSSYCPNKNMLAIGYDNIVKIIDKNHTVAEFVLEPTIVIELIDFDCDRIIVGANKLDGTLYIICIKVKLNNNNIYEVSEEFRSFCVGKKFGSIKIYEKYVLVSYVIDDDYSEFAVLNYTNLSVFKGYIRKTSCPTDFIYVEVCKDYLLLVYDNILELIENFELNGTITLLPSKILSVVSEYWFYSFNIIVSCAYVTEQNQPSLLVTPTITNTPGDTSNLRFYYINEEGLFIKNKTNIIGDPYSLSISTDKKTLAMSLGKNVIFFDVIKWCEILCGTTIYIGTGSNVTIIFTSNTKVFISNKNSSDLNNLIWLDVC